MFRVNEIQVIRNNVVVGLWHHRSSAVLNALTLRPRMMTPNEVRKLEGLPPWPEFGT